MVRGCSAGGRGRLVGFLVGRAIFRELPPCARTYRTTKNNRPVARVLYTTQLHQPGVASSVLRTSARGRAQGGVSVCPCSLACRNPAASERTSQIVLRALRPQHSRAVCNHVAVWLSRRCAQEQGWLLARHAARLGSHRELPSCVACAQRAGVQVVARRSALAHSSMIRRSTNPQFTFRGSA